MRYTQAGHPHHAPLPSPRATTSVLLSAGEKDTSRNEMSYRLSGAVNPSTNASCVRSRKRMVPS